MALGMTGSRQPNAVKTAPHLPCPLPLCVCLSDLVRLAFLDSHPHSTANTKKLGFLLTPFGECLGRNMMTFLGSLASPFFGGDVMLNCLVLGGQTSP